VGYDYIITLQQLLATHASNVNKATALKAKAKAMTFKAKATTPKTKDKIKNVRKCDSSHLIKA